MALVSTGSTAARIADAGRAGDAGRGAHRLPRVPRRPGQDAAPAGARRDPGRPAASPSTVEQLERARASSRSTWWWSTSTRSPRPWPPAPRPTSASSRSTSAARRWCARPRRTTRRSRSWSPRRATTTCWPTRCATGGFTLAQRRRLAAEAFAHTATYDVAVASWMGNVVTDTSDGTGFPAWVGATWGRDAVLRYGENPHQPAALYRSGRGGLAGARAAARQGDVLQQLRRHRRRAPGGVRLRRSRRWRSSSTPTRAASRSATTWPRPTARPTRATRSRPSAA